MRSKDMPTCGCLSRIFKLCQYYIKKPDTEHPTFDITNPFIFTPEKPFPIKKSDIEHSKFEIVAPFLSTICQNFCEKK